MGAAEGAAAAGLLDEVTGPCQCDLESPKLTEGLLLNLQSLCKEKTSFLIYKYNCAKYLSFLRLCSI